MSNIGTMLCGHRGYNGHFIEIYFTRSLRTQKHAENEKSACRFQSNFSHGNENMGQSCFSVGRNEVTHNTETKYELAWYYNDTDTKKWENYIQMLLGEREISN